MTIIYIVTSGQYSDYSISGVFDSQEKAQSYIDYGKQVDAFGWDEPLIEEWEINKYYDAISRGLRCFRVHFDNINEGDGAASITTLIESNQPEEDTYSARNASGRTTGYQTIVWATDEAAALKIGNERRMRYLLNTESQPPS